MVLAGFRGVKIFQFLEFIRVLGGKVVRLAEVIRWTKPLRGGGKALSGFA